MANANKAAIELSDIIVCKGTMLYLDTNMEVVGILERYEDGMYLIERLSRAGGKLGKCTVEEEWFTHRIELKQEDGYEYIND